MDEWSFKEKIRKTKQAWKRGHFCPVGFLFKFFYSNFKINFFPTIWTCPWMQLWNFLSSVVAVVVCFGCLSVQHVTAAGATNGIVTAAGGWFIGRSVSVAPSTSPPASFSCRLFVKTLIWCIRGRSSYCTASLSLSSPPPSPFWRGC